MKSLKKSLILFCIIIITLSANAQLVWQTLGDTMAFRVKSANPQLIVYENSPYVLYEDSTVAGKLSVKTFDGTNWVYVGAPGFASSRNGEFNMNVNSLGQIHVLFINNDFVPQLEVMKFNNTSWVNIGSSVVPAVGATSYLNISFLNGTPYVSYSNDSNTYIHKFESNNWVIHSTFNNPGAVFYNGYNQMVIQNNEIFISKNMFGIGISVKKYNGNNWDSLPMIIDTIMSSRYDMVLSNSNQPIISYVSRSDSFRIKSAIFNGSNWTSYGSPNVGGGSSVAFGVDAVINNQNTPFVVFTNFDGNHVSMYNGNNWESIDAVGFDQNIISHEGFEAGHSSLFVLLQPASSTFRVMKLDLCGDINVSISQDVNKLIAHTNSHNVSFQWMDCSNIIIPNATDSVFIPNLNGDYAVITNNLRCVDTSNCVVVTNVGIWEDSNEKLISIFPNPASHLINITYNVNKLEALTIIDMNGRIVYETNTKTEVIDISALPVGVYTLKITTQEETVFKQIVKK